MANDNTPNEHDFLAAIERLLGRRLDERETQLANSLRNEKSAELVARELEGTVIADPKKIRPEHSDTANE